MATFSTQQIPPPKYWQEFEDLCADLWEKIWNDPNTLKHGRTGQPQCGVDVYGQINGDGDWQGVQCKGKDGRYGKKVTERELKKEVEKAKNFSPSISNFILATTAPDDASIQQVARELTEENKKTGSFSVVVIGWDEILRRLKRYPDLIDAHFPDQGPKLDKLMGKIDSLESVGTLIEENKQFLETGFQKIADLIVSTKGIEAGPYVYDGVLNQADEPLHKEIDGYRDLIKRKPKTAIELLQQLKERCWGDASDSIKFRIITNIGAGNYTLGLNDVAAEFFLDAKQYAQNDHKAICNVTLAYIVKDDFDKAKYYASKAVSIDPENSTGYQVLIAAHAKDESISNIVNLIPFDKLEQADVSYALGHAYRRRGDKQNSYTWLEKAYEADPTNLQMRVSFAETILEKFFDDQSRSIGGQFNEQDEQNLGKAVTILESVWREVSNTELEDLYIATAINLCNVYSSTDKFDACRSLLDDVIRLKPDSVDARKLSTLFALRLGDADLALRNLEFIPQNASFETDLLRVESLIKLTRYDEALDILTQIDPNEEDLLLFTTYTELRIRLLFETQGKDSAFEEANKVKNKYSNNQRMIISVAACYDSFGAKDIALKLISEIDINSIKMLPYRDRLYISEVLFELEQYNQAAEIYRGLVTSNKDSHVIRRLLISLLNIDQRHEVSETLDKISSSDLEHTFFHKFRAKFYLRTGELENACNEIEAYLQNVSDDLEYRLMWVSILRRQGNHSTIKEFLSDAPDFSTASPEDQMHLSYIFYYYGYLERASELAYRVSRENSRDSKILQGYIGLFLLEGFNEFIYEYKTVAQDTAFTIENQSGEKKNLIIENDTFNQSLNGEIDISHPFAVQALGKSSGEYFNVQLNPFQDEKWKIINIKHKYIYYLHNIIENFNSLFPNESNFYRVNIERAEDGTPDLTPIKKSIDDRNSVALQAERLYQNDQYPIGLIANMLGIDPIDVFRGFVRLGRVSVRCCIGDFVERDNAFQLFSTYKDRFMIDVVTLYIAHSLDILDVLINVTGRLGVTQSTLDLIQSKIHLIKIMPPSAAFSKVNDEYVLIDYTDETIHQEISLLEILSDWIRSNCDIIAAIGSQDLSPKLVNLGDTIGHSFVDTLFAASGSDRILLCEDLHFRLIAKDLFNLDGVWLQSALQFALKKRIVSLSRYSEIVSNLLEMNIHFISIDSNFLFSLAKLDGWSVTSRFKRACDTLGDSNVDLATALDVTVEFLLVIWGEQISPSSQEKYTYAILNSLKAWKNLFIVWYLAIKLLMFDCRKSILPIKRWCDGHFIPFPIS